MQIRTALQTARPLLVLGSLVVFSPLIEGGTTHFPVLVVRLLLLFALTGWALRAMQSGRITVHRSSLYLPIAVFLGWAAFSVVRSSYTAVSLQWLVSLLSYLVLLVLVLQHVESVKEVWGVVALILSMGVFEAAWGIYQVMWLDHSRATGTFFNSNFFATYETGVLAVAFGLLCFGRREHAIRWERMFLWATAALATLAFLLARSRGALLAYVAAVAFVGLARFGKVFVVVLALGLFLGAIVPNPLQQRFLTVREDPYAYTRLDIWKNSLQRIADQPWGVGMGLYKYTSFRYRFPVEGQITRYGKRAETAHNEYLQMGVELGVVGVAIFLVGTGLLGREVWTTLKGQLNGWERGLVIGLTGGILGALTHAAVDSVFHEPALVLLFVLFAGVILVMKRLRVPGVASVWVVPFPYHPARVAMVGTLALLGALLIVRPAGAWYAFEKGEHELAVGRANQALAWFQWATRIDPGLSAYHDAAASAEAALYQQSGEIRWLLGAVEELRVGLELNPLDSRLAHRLGNLYILLADRAGPGRPREALLSQAAGYYEHAIQLDPYSPLNYLELGRLRWTQGQLEAAQGWFKRAISYEPNFLPARIDLAELALQTGQKEAAALEYAEILKIKQRYQGRALNALERRYLEADDEHLKRSLGVMKTP
jgi:O-antigen ligase/Tfp pilus assembly protein PilF